MRILSSLSGRRTLAAKDATTRSEILNSVVVSERGSRRCPASRYRHGGKSSAGASALRIFPASNGGAEPDPVFCHLVTRGYSSRVDGWGRRPRSFLWFERPIYSATS